MYNGNYNERNAQIIRSVDTVMKQIFEMINKGDGGLEGLIQEAERIMPGFGTMVNNAFTTTATNTADVACDEVLCKKHTCKCETYCVEVEIPDNCCVVSTMVSQTGTKVFCENCVCWISVSFDVYVTYREYGGCEKTISKQSGVIFTCVPEWAQEDFTVYVPNCPQVKQHCDTVTVRGLAKLCY